MGSSSGPQKTTGTQTTQKLSSPAIESALALYMPKLMGMICLLYTSPSPRD